MHDCLKHVKLHVLADFLCFKSYQILHYDFQPLNMKMIEESYVETEFYICW